MQYFVLRDGFHFRRRWNSYSILSRTASKLVPVISWLALRREGFLNFVSILMWVVRFTPRPLYARGKSTMYPLTRRLGEPQSRSGRYGEGNILDPTGTRTPTPQSCSAVWKQTCLLRSESNGGKWNCSGAETGLRDGSLMHERAPARWRFRAHEMTRRCCSLCNSWFSIGVFCCGRWNEYGITVHPSTQQIRNK
jgi:hypothetical protein